MTDSAGRRVTDKNKTPVVLIVAAWLAVSLPAAWGVYNTVLNALKLFEQPTAASRSNSEPSKSK
jgi:hypothetical protein